MPAGPVGSVWADGTWTETGWEAGVWADAVDADIYWRECDATVNTRSVFAARVGAQYAGEADVMTSFDATATTRTRLAVTATVPLEVE